VAGVPTTDEALDQTTREQQVRRAREVLSDAGWLFDDFVNNEMRKVLVSQPEERDQREEAYRRARVATEMKAGLESLIETYEADMRLKERRERTLTPAGRRLVKVTGVPEAIRSRRFEHAPLNILSMGCRPTGSGAACITPVASSFSAQAWSSRSSPKS
jgi:hypothetical protein